MKEKILNRFLKYIAIDTTSNSNSKTSPSTISQKELATVLLHELESLNIDEIYYDDAHCYIYAKLSGDPKLPKIGFISHLDTSEDAKGNNINPNIIKNYDGKIINLKVGELNPSDYPCLNNHINKTIITTDGSTLLGADNKAGIAEIMTMLEYFSTNDIKHGDIYVCFTPDEEIGNGTTYFNTDYFDVDFAYTVDGGESGEFSYECFNAASAYIEIAGVSAHCGSAKGKMINASKIAIEINSLLPNETPENTENYEGFFHLDEISGTVSSATIKYLIRDFDENNFIKRKKTFEDIVQSINKKYGNIVTLTIKDTYKNMLSEIKKYPSLIEDTKTVISSLNITPKVLAIRGGTDGSEISHKGIPCPNLGVGAYNFHSVHEYACLEEMEESCNLLIAIIKYFSSK